MEFFITVSLFVCCLTPFQAEGIEDYEQGLSHGSRARLKELKDYEIVEPKQLTFGQKPRYKRDLTTQINELTEEHSPNVKFQFNFNGVSHIIGLSNNRLLLPANYSYSVVSKSGVTMYKATEKDYNHCNYVGILENITDSHARINTCSGLRGFIGTPDDFLFIEPLEDNKHVVYRQVLDDSHSFCGVQDLKNNITDWNITSSFPNANLEEDEEMEKLKTRKPEYRITPETLYIELMLVVDQKKAAGSSKEALMKRMIELVNFMDGYYYKLNIRVVLVHTQIWQINPVMVPISTDSSRNLDNFLRYKKWKQETLGPSSPWRYSDAVQLVSGEIFQNDVLGLAPVGRICSMESAAVIMDSGSSIFTARTAAHELGHNLGMLHDTKQCQCERKECLMHPYAGGRSINNWSSCSRHYAHISRDQGLFFCLKNVPDPSTILGKSTCGNLFVEEGEECDCGPPQLCVSTCCDPNTCKLIGNSVCDDGRCCENCQFVRQGVECRETKQECDFAEYCLGYSGHCLGDFHAQDGSRCGANLCHEGVCRTDDKQCQSLWGPDSRSCPDVAYSFNYNGPNVPNKIGNCGKERSGNFVACDASNARCGKLMCYGGKGRPLMHSIGYYELTYSKHTFTCKVLQSPSTATDKSELGLVLDLTKCGHNRVCVENQCVEWKPSKCSENCNGNGICNNMGNCHCDAGWAPPFCLHRGLDKGWGGSIDGGVGSAATKDGRKTASKKEKANSDASKAFRHGANTHIYCIFLIKALDVIFFY